MNYGIIIYNEKLWLGSTIYNLLQPDISLSSSKNNLNRNYSIHGGINIDERSDLKPVYGTVKPLKSFNPFWANIEVFYQMIFDSYHTQKL